MENLNTPARPSGNTFEDGRPRAEKETYVGLHVVAEFWECPINEASFNFKAAITGAARAANAELLLYKEHRFNPVGCTAFAILGESHISIHTWPEKQYIAVDIFTCGAHTAPHEAIAYLKAQLKPKRFEVNTMHRGRISGDW